MRRGISDYPKLISALPGLAKAGGMHGIMRAIRLRRVSRPSPGRFEDESERNTIHFYGLRPERIFRF
jgi:hypothetical protein